MIYVGLSALGYWAWMLKGIDGGLIASSSGEAGHATLTDAMRAALRAYDRAKEKGDPNLPDRPRFVDCSN